MEGQAFQIFKRKGWWNIPTYSIAVSSIPALLAFISISVDSNTVNP
jgi:amino acid permease